MNITADMYKVNCKDCLKLEAAAPQAVVPESTGRKLRCEHDIPVDVRCPQCGPNAAAVPESQDGIDPTKVERTDPELIEQRHGEAVVMVPYNDGAYVLAKDFDALNAQLIATRAELRNLKLAASLACELHGCASTRCTMARYHEDVQKLFADLAAAQAQIANLTKGA